MNWRIIVWRLTPTPILRLLDALRRLRLRIHYRLYPLTDAQLAEDLHRVARLLHQNHMLTPDAARDIAELIEELNAEQPE